MMIETHVENILQKTVAGCCWILPSRAGLAGFSTTEFRNDFSFVEKAFDSSNNNFSSSHPKFVLPVPDFLTERK